MKLIDLLVQELPKRGGWPEGVYVIEQNYHGKLFNCSEASEPFLFDSEKFEKVDAWREARVTRKQYEAALAAAQQPVWDGEGLPPVGVKAEVSVDGGRSWCSYKATSENNGMRLVEIGNFTEEFQGNNWMFRPIRSEADRKRDEAIAALKKLKPQLVGELAGYLYDEIAAGKIPHIRIEHAA
ncbi:hypothetical protein [Cronobacter sakazakii]|uniref:hypothetical protein n=1 Tax=Cronobacter sakazakii TaxID=28141 RepID=UPI0009BAB1C3|nr:hypothetical protein [Cronobacter sakazakii]PUY20353.1 hypothetical protein BTK72_03800 [Cronobacter sakazakii]